MAGDDTNDDTPAMPKRRPLDPFPRTARYEVRWPLTTPQRRTLIDLLALRNPADEAAAVAEIEGALGEYAAHLAAGGNDAPPSREAIAERLAEIDRAVKALPRALKALHDQALLAETADPAAVEVLTLLEAAGGVAGWRATCEQATEAGRRIRAIVAHVRTGLLDETTARRPVKHADRAVTYRLARIFKYSQDDFTLNAKGEGPFPRFARGAAKIVNPKYNGALYFRNIYDEHRKLTKVSRK